MTIKAEVMTQLWWHRQVANISGCFFFVLFCCFFKKRYAVVRSTERLSKTRPVYDCWVPFEYICALYILFLLLSMKALSRAYIFEHRLNYLSSLETNRPENLQLTQLSFTSPHPFTLRLLQFISISPTAHGQAGPAAWAASEIDHLASWPPGNWTGWG